jgi:hypothetical protein
LLLGRPDVAESVLLGALAACPGDRVYLTEILGRLNVRIGRLAIGLDQLTQAWGDPTASKGSPALDAPVAVFAFNRPDPTALVMAAVRAAKPSVLLLVADGPREDRPGEAELCAQVRALMSAVDWPCEVHTNFAERNMGCRNRVASGLAWVFETVETAIILEDDTIPHPSFFAYAADLLKRYADDPRIGLIGGTALHSHRYQVAESYYFSSLPQTWGWATWRRAWAQYDVNMTEWPRLRETDFLDRLWSPAGAQFFRNAFENTHAGRIDTWDFQLHFMVMAHNLLTIVPRRNLVTNIGVGPSATHTHNPDANICYPWTKMEYPLSHPPQIERDVAVDETFFHRLPGEQQNWMLRL